MKRISWNKGKGKLLTNYGYRRITTPDGRRMQEHRYVMEMNIGRRLKPKEVVHHINHNKTDNRIENLELLTNHSVHIKLYPEVRCTRRWDLINVPEIRFHRWNMKPRIESCHVKSCKRNPKIGYLCKPCYLSWWKWKKGRIRNHFSKKANV